MVKTNIEIMSDGSVVILDSLGTKSEYRVNDNHIVVVTDCRTLTDSAQYQIGWHDGYRAQFNEKNNAEYLAKDKRMVASLKLEQKDSIGG
jgi:hypothetical protein